MFLQVGVWLFFLTLLAGAEVAVQPVPLAITSMDMQGGSLLITASVPSGLETVALETRPALDAPWQDVQETNAPSGGGSVTFSFSPSAGAETSRFFRLRGSPIPNPVVQSAKTQTEAQAQVLSTELEYVPTSSLGERLLEGNAVFHFKGIVDGSDKIFITRNGALWTHVNWSFPPEPVSVNGTQWNPDEKNYMSTAGHAKFLPESFSLQSAFLEPIKGRDTVALEVCSNGVVVYLDDIPGGADEYEFNVKFPPISRQLPPTSQSTVTNLKISAVVDGSDCIKITSREAVLNHKYYALPSGLTVNGISWDVTQTLVLTNEGSTQFLPSGIDFSTARVVSRQGRDLATAWGNKDALWVKFADNPNGADNYEIEIAFGPQ